MKALRPLALVALGALAACSAAPSDDQPTNDAPVTTVDDTAVKEQSIGNCWLYATAGWVESMHLVATKETIDVSEGYWSFWYWFEEITGGDLGLSAQWGIADQKQVAEGGWWGIGAELITRYGWVNEGDFFPGADKDTKSVRHKEAVDAVNLSLKSGLLKDVFLRKNKKLVLEELARIWKLEPAAVADLEKVFGANVQRTLYDKLTPTEGTLVHRASELAVPAADGIRTVTLADVVGTREVGTTAAQGRRVGVDAWSEVPYLWGSDAAGAARQKAIVRNMQDTLHRRLALPLAWAVGNAENGAYAGTQYQSNGLHESLIVDYQADNVPGFGQLPVGVPVNNPAALEAALSPDTKVTLFRIKNSWGADPFYSAEEWKQFGTDQPLPTTAKVSFLPAKPGYNDLTTEYLDSDMQVGLSWKVDPHMMLAVALPNALRFPIPAQVEPLRSFVTQTAYRGSDLGGLAGADEACKTSAARGSIKGNFKAYLSAMGEGPNMRFDAPETHRYMAIQRAYGTQYTMRLQFAGHPGFDEYGLVNTGGLWTGLGATDGSTSCGGWTKDGTGSTNQGFTPVACSQRRQLLCIQDR